MILKINLRRILRLNLRSLRPNQGGQLGGQDADVPHPGETMPERRSVFPSENLPVRYAIETGDCRTFQAWPFNQGLTDRFRALAGGLRLVVRKIAFKKAREIIFKITDP